VGWDEEYEKIIKEEVNGFLEQKGLRWRQRAKEEWLRNGHRNTKYFHACANQQKKSN
jgi:hypothetical protein